jgi:hypothetical protein
MTATLVQSELDLVLLSFKEDNTFIVYAPTLDLSGYGDNQEEADSSFEESLDEFLDFTIKNNTLHSELMRLGWKSNFKAPFLDILLQKSPYLAQIVREKNFTKTQRTYTIPFNNHYL